MILAAPPVRGLRQRPCHEVVEPAGLQVAAEEQHAGRARNPDQVYSDERVTPTVDDGRAFLRKTDRRYDLIIFALPDSVTLLSGSASIRLESFLFTRESFEAAKARLKPDGAFVIYNFYREAWLVDRFAGMLEATFGKKPCSLVSPNNAHLAVLAVEAGGEPLNCKSRDRPLAAEAPATDDWPFPYLRNRSVPWLYVRSLLIIAAMSLLAIALVTPRGTMARVQPDFFLLGAAFLLLETKSIAQFSLLFGATWIVNAAVFAGVLGLALISALLADRPGRIPLVALGALLALALAVQWALPLDRLVGLPSAPKYLLGVLVNLGPIFCSGLLFARLLRDRGGTVEAISWNLLGTMLGGCVEYSPMLLGYRNLTLVIAVLYGLALILATRAKGGRTCLASSLRVYGPGKGPILLDRTP